jgi:hypothetical protein
MVIVFSDGSIMTLSKSVEYILRSIVYSDGVRYRQGVVLTTIIDIILNRIKDLRGKQIYEKLKNFVTVALFLREQWPLRLKTVAALMGKE